MRVFSLDDKGDSGVVVTGASASNLVEGAKKIVKPLQRQRLDEFCSRGSIFKIFFVEIIFSQMKNKGY